MKFKFAFTLAEIMIVLTLIGIMTAILLPVAISSTPNENIMKFKKANNILGNVIRELVSSGEYYTPGDLGVKPDGTVIDGSHQGDDEYFCQTFSDMLSVKINNCKEMDDVYPNAKISWFSILPDDTVGLYDEETDTTTYTKTDIWLDSTCKGYNEAGKNNQIVTTDGIVYYQTWPHSPFGIRNTEGCGWDEEANRCLNAGERVFINYKRNNMYAIYTGICIDIDGADKGEDPFGYALRVDGKLVLGARAKEWLEKILQDKE